MKLTFLALWSVWGTNCVSCIGSLTNVSLNSFCDNFEPLRWQMLTLLRMVNSRRWKKQLICPFSVLSANGVKVCHATRFVNLRHMAITVSLLRPVSEIHSHHRKCSLLVDIASLSVCSHFFCPSTSWLSSNHHPGWSVYCSDWISWIVEHKTGIKHETKSTHTILIAEGRKFAFGVILH